MLKNYKIEFDSWALFLFLVIMVPNLIWSIIPAPNDILRAISTTKIIDLFTSISQLLMILSLFFLKSNKYLRLKKTLFVVIVEIFCTLYYLSWFAYYKGFISTVIILGLTISPCLAFLFFSIDRKNKIAITLTSLFTFGHLIYAFVNFIN